MKPVNRDLLSLNRLIHIRTIDGYELRNANVLLCELSMELSTCIKAKISWPPHGTYLE